MLALYALVVFVGLIACALWAWLCYVLVWPKTKAKQNGNPYIEQHKLKMYNDKLYDEYEDWLSENGHGVPVPKLKSPEDIEAEKKINKLI